MRHHFSKSHHEKDVQEASYIRRSPERTERPRQNKKVQRTVSTLVVVLCFAFLVMGGVNLVSATSNAYVLVVDGEDIATLVSRGDAESALQLCLDNQSRIYEDQYSFTVTYTNDVDIREVSAAGAVFSSPGDAALLLAEHLDMQAEAVALYVDARPVLYVATEDAAISAVNEAKSYYGVAGEDNVAKVYTSEQISMNRSTVACDEVLSVSEAARVLLYGTTELTAELDPMITVNVEKEIVTTTELEYGTVRVNDNSLPRGKEEVVTAGVNGLQEVTMRVVETNGVEVSSQTLASKVLVDAVDEVVNVGTRMIIKTDSGDFVLSCPLSGNYIISSKFGWRSRGWHSGLDLAAAYDSVIYAAEAGTVTVVESQSGYGNVVYIDHGDGLQTRYAHNNLMFVSVGDHVERGQSIATIGMTGTTTGPHIHFEVRVDGSPVDPLPYLGI